MFKRFVRWIRSVFGGAVAGLEDPEKILQQNIRDLNDQIPAMNENIAMVKANVNLAQKQLAALSEKEGQLRARITAALQAGKRDLALNFATTFEQVQTDKAASEANLDLAKRSLEKAMRVREAFQAERDRKIKEAMRAISLSRQAKWQEQVANTMQTFEVAGIDQTHDEMVRKIEETVAKAQAKMEMALESPSIETFEIEKEAEKMQANETLRQFEIELGLVAPEAVPVQKTMGTAETSAAEPSPAPREKTMGRE
ncbi:PspA/IM30 family protein [bacterium]|nr:PspA/IM30 family protein [bacterium]